MKMKGVILAGGSGSRLLPLTRVSNKHLLPVGNKPMIQYCVEKLVESDISDILVVTGGNHIGHIAEYLGSGRDFGCQITYRVQDEAGGIAQALSLANGFIREDETMCVILGDNIFEDNLKQAIACYQFYFQKNEIRAMVMLKRVSDPKRFGVAIFDNDGKVIGIDEKPQKPKSDFAVTGIYLYDFTVFHIIATLRPSHRGELEITDVNNAYIELGKMGKWVWEGWWTDAGTPESYWLANELIRKKD